MTSRGAWRNVVSEVGETQKGWVSSIPQLEGSGGVEAPVTQNNVSSSDFFLDSRYMGSRILMTSNFFFL